jgi:hypothetical protein
MPSNEMRILLLILLIGILTCCQKTNDTKQAAEVVPTDLQTSEDEAYAKNFVEKAKNSEGLLLPRIGSLIKDRQAAVAVAEAILFKVYGEENISKQKPYRVYKTDHYWVITGTLPEGTLGGVFEIALDVNDARVIGLTHGK